MGRVEGRAMEHIVIKEDVIPEIKALMDLYEDVEWYAYTKDGTKLKNAIENSLKVVTAWDGNKLVGLIRVVGDNHTRYLHNLKSLILLTFFSKQKGFHPMNVEYIK